MRGLSFIIALFGVIAMLTLGTTGAWASAAPMSCHEMTSSAAHGDISQGGDAPTPVHTPAKAQMVMGCCMACVSPAMPQVPAAIAAKHPLLLQPTRLDLPRGRSPSPEHGPPKPSL
ncbi:MAG: hypothetical protein JWR59_808 [Brevundimonas sp.]|nr:hypothetical protein [Brevundimonas sp.]